MCKNVDVVFRHDSGGANVLAALVVKQGVDRDSCIFAMTQFLPFFSLFGLSGSCLIICFLYFFVCTFLSFNLHLLLWIRKEEERKWIGCYMN